MLVKGTALRVVHRHIIGSHNGSFLFSPPLKTTSAPRSPARTSFSLPRTSSPNVPALKLHSTKTQAPTTYADGTLAQPAADEFDPMMVHADRRHCDRGGLCVDFNRHQAKRD